MLFAFEDNATLYAALLARDVGYDGRAYVGVTSTGVFCRLTCPARKPKPENCRFHPTMPPASRRGSGRASDAIRCARLPNAIRP